MCLQGYLCGAGLLRVPWRTHHNRQLDEWLAGSSCRHWIAITKSAFRVEEGHLLTFALFGKEKVRGHRREKVLAARANSLGKVGLLLAIASAGNVGGHRLALLRGSKVRSPLHSCELCLTVKGSEC